jgi:PEP-CTERM motif
VLNIQKIQQMSQRLALTGLLVVAAQAQASMVTLVGQDFDISYDTASVDALFGTPAVVGNTIRFTPVNFSAQSLRGDEVVTRTATTHVILQLHAGRQLASASLVEQGSYTLSGTQSFVDVGGQIRLFDLNNFSNEVTARLLPSGNLNLADGHSHSWQAAATANIPAHSALALASRLNLTLENSLEAYTDANETGLVQAMIVKSTTPEGISIQISTVPEPESWALSLVALGGLLAMSLRHRRTQPGGKQGSQQG